MQPLGKIFDFHTLTVVHKGKKVGNGKVAVKDLISEMYSNFNRYYDRKLLDTEDHPHEYVPPMFYTSGMLTQDYAMEQMWMVKAFMFYEMPKDIKFGYPDTETGNGGRVKMLAYEDRKGPVAFDCGTMEEEDTTCTWI